MKKLIFTLFALLVSASSFAQFERDKIYINASLTGAGLSYSSATDLNLGLNATAGLFIEDCWAAVAEADLNYAGNKVQEFGAGAGLRYYIIQNGLYLGLGGRYQHGNLIQEERTSFNDLQIKAEVGYAFFLSRTVTVEPAVYYKHSFKDNDLSAFGLKVGFGLYF